MKYFASDNYSGAHPAILDALQKANCETMPAYGNDIFTAQARELFASHFGNNARVHFVFTGTAANVLSLKCMVKSYEAIVCTTKAHIHTDECGAPEAIIGAKLVTLPTRDGKLSPESLETVLPMRDEAPHMSFPKVVSLAQTTECGTCYSLDALCKISAWCHKKGFYLHMDGARLANAAAAAGCGLKEMTHDVGVDVLSFGGAKNGLLFGEAVVFFNDYLGHEFAYIQKQHMQLASKMRYVGAQFAAYLSDDLWRKNAAHANEMMRLLHELIVDVPCAKEVYDVQANALFLRMPKKAVQALAKSFYFYVIDPLDDPEYPSDWQLVRFMTSFATTEAEVREFAEAIKSCGDFC